MTRHGPFDADLTLRSALRADAVNPDDAAALRSVRRIPDSIPTPRDTQEEPMSSRRDEQVSVDLTDVPWGAAYDALLAIEGFAARVYPPDVRRNDPKSQQRYNDLAAVVLPLRDAVDGTR
jgi:hypothetical protein